MTRTMNSQAATAPADTDIEAAVTLALRSYEAMRPWAEDITVHSRQGVVDLRGVVASALHKPIAEKLARDVPGVRDVENHLISDVDIAIAVAAALAQDSRTQDARLLVNSTLGHVELLGTAPSAQALAAAVEIARGVPGVASVRSTAQVLP